MSYKRRHMLTELISCNQNMFREQKTNPLA